MQNATAVRNAFAVALSRIAHWFERAQQPKAAHGDLKLTDALERELCDREARRRTH